MGSDSKHIISDNSKIEFKSASPETSQNFKSKNLKSDEILKCRIKSKEDVLISNLKNKYQDKINDDHKNLL